MTLYELLVYAVRGATKDLVSDPDNKDWEEIVEFTKVWDHTHGDVKLEDLILLEVPHDEEVKDGKKENG